jgi:hypothetical protein
MPETVFCPFGSAAPLQSGHQGSAGRLQAHARSEIRRHDRRQSWAPLPGMTGQNRRALDCVDAEKHWKNADDIKSLAGYQDHLARFPNCDFAVQAKARIEALQKK